MAGLLFITGGLSTANAGGIYIYECFKERQCTYFVYKLVVNIDVL